MDNSKTKLWSYKSVIIGYLLIGLIMAVGITLYNHGFKGKKYSIDLEGNVISEEYSTYNKEGIFLPPGVRMLESPKEELVMGCLESLLGFECKYDSSYPLGKGLYGVWNKKTKCCGVANKWGKWVIEPEYYNFEMVNTVIKASVGTYDDQSYGLFDLKGNEILCPEYKSIEYLKSVDRIVAVDVNGNSTLLSGDGKTVLLDRCPYIYLVASEYNEKEVEPYFVISDGKAYFICDKDGKRVSDFTFDGFRKTTDKENLIVFKNGKAGVISKEGKILIDISYSDIEEECKRSGTAYIVTTLEGLVGVVSVEDGVIIEPQEIAGDYYRFEYDSKVLCVETSEDTWTFVSNDSETRTIRCYSVYLVGNGIFEVHYRNEQYGEICTLVDKDLKELPYVTYNDKASDITTTFVDGKLLVVAEYETNGKTSARAIYDGNIIMQAGEGSEYLNIYTNSEGLLFAQKEKAIDIFNLNNECIFTARYVNQNYYSCIVVENEDGLDGLIKADGEILLNAEYEQITLTKNDLMAVVKCKNGKYGLYDCLNCKWYYKPQFADAEIRDEEVKVTLFLWQGIKREKD